MFITVKLFSFITLTQQKQESYHPVVHISRPNTAALLASLKELTFKIALTTNNKLRYFYWCNQRIFLSFFHPFIVSFCTNHFGSMFHMCTESFISVLITKVIKRLCCYNIPSSVITIFQNIEVGIEGLTLKSVQCFCSNHFWFHFCLVCTNSILLH